MKIKDIVPGQRYAVGAGQSVVEGLVLAAPATIERNAGAPYGAATFRRIPAGQKSTQVLVIHAVGQTPLTEAEKLTVLDILALTRRQRDFIITLCRPTEVVMTWADHLADVAQRRAAAEDRQRRQAALDAAARSEYDTLVARLDAVGIDGRVSYRSAHPRVVLTHAQVALLLDRAHA